MLLLRSGADRQGELANLARRFKDDGRETHTLGAGIGKEVTSLG